MNAISATTDSSAASAPHGATLASLLRTTSGARLVQGSDEHMIREVTEDSRRVSPGSLFVAVRGGHVDGARYVPQACAAGAVAVVAERPLEVPRGVSLVLVEDTRRALAELSAAWHGHPGHALRLVGVTGTNGKTTTAFLVHALLTALGECCGRLGTVDTDLGAGPVSAAAYTTPPAEELHEALAAMRANGCGYAAMEVSSQALDQQRTHGLPFAAALFTNLTQDHLDYHETFAHYAAAKASLFAQLAPDGSALLNGDDEHVGAMLAACKAEARTFGLGRHNLYRATTVLCSASRSRFRLLYPGGALNVETPLTGEYNVRNVLGAFALAHALGYEAGEIAQRLRTIRGAPGRLERVVLPGYETAPLQVYVDYAHTPDALEKALRALRAANVNAPITVVFGCGGERDATKRPQMGGIAARLADKLVLTSDNPRSEDPAAILDDIAAGIPCETLGRTRAFVERAAAIEHAVAEAEPGEIVLIAGKGHETYQVVGNDAQPFDDREAVREVLQARLTPRVPLRLAG